MTAPSITYFWSALLGSAAMLAVILTALGLMVGLVKAADIPRKLGSLLAILIALAILPGILMSAWAKMSLWQQIALAAISVVSLLALVPKRKKRNKQEG